MNVPSRRVSDPAMMGLGLSVIIGASDFRSARENAEGLRARPKAVRVRRRSMNECPQRWRVPKLGELGALTWLVLIAREEANTRMSEGRLL